MKDAYTLKLAGHFDPKSIGYLVGKLTNLSLNFFTLYLFANALPLGFHLIKFA